jgi:hypothetical protein
MPHRETVAGDATAKSATSKIMFIGRGHGDDLARVQAQLLVVVQHGVHVLDPNRVHGAVQHHPLAVRALVLRAAAVHDGQDAVLPLVRLRVVLPVELPHRDRLRVHHFVLALHLALLAALRHQRQRARQDAVRLRLARKRLPDDHQPVPHDDHLVQLDRLQKKYGSGCRFISTHASRMAISISA